MAETNMHTGWQKEKAGFILGLSGQQAALIGFAAVCGFVPLITKSLTALAFFGPIGVVLVAVALVRVEGRVGAEWAHLAVANRINAFLRSNRYRSTPVSRAMGPDGEFVDQDDDDRMELPGVLAPLRLVVSQDRQGRPFAAVNHRLDHTWTSTALVSAQGLSLSDSDGINRTVAGWSSQLAQLCQEAGLVARVAAYHCVEMSDGDELRSWNEAHIERGANPEAVDNLRSLFVEGRRKVADHMSYLTVTIDTTKCRREVKNAGGGDAGAMAVLLRQVLAITGSVRAAGVEIERWLDHQELAGVIRSAFAPGERRLLTAASLRARAAGRDGGGGVPAAFAGPTTAETRWGVYRHDDAWSLTGEVDWPRTPRDASLLSGLLAASDKGRRHLALHYEPIGPREAERILISDKTRREAAIGMRAKTGQAAPERERRELALSTIQDQQLAAGHGLIRFAGYVSVTVNDPDDLEGAWDELVADAGQHGMSVRRCSGWQDAAFACAAVPVGMGLPRSKRL